MNLRTGRVSLVVDLPLAAPALHVASRGTAKQNHIQTIDGDYMAELLAICPAISAHHSEEGIDRTTTFRW